MSKKRAQFLDGEGGRELVTVFCPDCDSRPLGAVQERWTIPSPTDPLVTHRVPMVVSLNRFGKTSASRLQPHRTERDFWCKRHGLFECASDKLHAAATQAMEQGTTVRLAATRRDWDAHATRNRNDVVR